MSANTSDFFESSEEFLPEGASDKIITASSKCYNHGDSDSGSETHPCLHQSLAKTFCSRENSREIEVGLDVQDSCGRFVKYQKSNTDDSTNEDREIFDMDSDSDRRKSSPLITNKRRKRISSNSCDKYFQNEDTPLISVRGEKTEKRKENSYNSPVIFNSLLHKVPLRRTASLNNISNKPLFDSVKGAATTDQRSLIPADSRSSASTSNSNRNAASPTGNSVTSCKPVTASDICDHVPNQTPHSPHPCPSVWCDQPCLAADTTRSFQSPYTQSSSRCFSKEAPMQQSNFQTCDHRHMCSSPVCPCRSSCGMDNRRDTSKCCHVFTLPSQLPGKPHLTYITPNCSSSLLTSNPTPETLNSFPDSPAQKTVSTLTSPNLRKPLFETQGQPSKNLLQVFVPRFKDSPEILTRPPFTKNPTHENKSHLEKGSLPEYSENDTSSYLNQSSPVLYTDPVSGSSRIKELSSCERKTGNVDIHKGCHVLDENQMPQVNSDSDGSKSSYQEKSRKPVRLPDDGHQEYAYSNSLLAECPHYIYTESSAANPRLPGTNEYNIQIHSSQNPKHSVPEPFCKPSLKATSLIPQTLDGSQTQDKSHRAENRSYGNNAAGSACTNLDSHRMKSSVPHTLCGCEHTSSGSTDTAEPGQHIFHSVDGNDTQRYSPSPHLTFDFASGEAKLTRHPSSTNNQIMTGEKIPERGYNTIQEDDQGYKAGMLLSVPSTYFEVNSLDHNDKKNRTNAGYSPPGSVNNQHQEYKDGSLGRSNTSESVLLNRDSESPLNLGYSDRDVPNYSYLCIVATILNPLFGLVAFLCNYYAQRHYRLHRRAQANNLYFAAITVSTVAIFLTLVGSSLIIARRVVMHKENDLVVASPSLDSCHDKFFGQDESVKLKKFFNVDFGLFCEITKNEKVMEALKRFWLEDHNNKRKHMNQKSEPKGKNGSQSGISGPGNDTNDDLSDGLLDVTSGRTGDTSSHKSQDTLRNFFGSNALDEPEPQRSNTRSHNTLLHSNDDPVIPPKLEEEYERYLKGEKQTKIDDINSYLRNLSLEAPAADSSFSSRATTATASGTYSTENNTMKTITLNADTTTTSADTSENPSNENISV